jgi:hypothetical protein
MTNYMKVTHMLRHLMYVSEINIEDLLCRTIDVSEVARRAVDRFARPGVKFSVSITPGMEARGCGTLAELLINDLIGGAILNAREDVAITFDRESDGEEPVFYVNVRGSGRKPLYTPTLGGMSLSKCIIERHEGLWKERTIQGSVIFVFTLRSQGITVNPHCHDRCMFCSPRNRQVQKIHAPDHSHRSPATSIGLAAG